MWQALRTGQFLLFLHIVCHASTDCLTGNLLEPRPVKRTNGKSGVFSADDRQKLKPCPLLHIVIADKIITLQDRRCRVTAGTCCLVSLLYLLQTASNTFNESAI